MIDKALEELKKSMGEYFKRLPEPIFQGEEQKIHLSHIIKQDGSIAIPGESLGLSLISIEEERAIKSQKTVATTPDGQVTHMNPELKLNLYILIVANFKEYKTGLQVLSGAIRFFQSKNVFTPQNTPGLDPAIQKLNVELYTLNLEQEHHLWGVVGGKYLPSVMYKVRLISIQEAQIVDEQPPIKIIEASNKGL